MRPSETVDAVVAGVIHFDPRQVHPRASERLWRELTFPNPAFLAAQRYGRRTDGIPEQICLIDIRLGRAMVPRGAVAIVRDALGEAGQSANFEDHRTLCAPVRFDFRFRLRDYQERAAATLAARVQGCAIMPCGSGKTVLGAATIARIGQPAIILVHTRDLVEQWLQTARDALGCRAGTIAGGTIEPADVTVATVQSLLAMDASTRRQLGQRFGTVVVDEAHRAPSRTFREVLSYLPGKYRFGLTATPKRSDGLTAMLNLCIGPELFRIGHRELVDAGHLVVPRVVAVETGTAVGARSHAAVVSELAQHTRRNQQLVSLVTREARAGCSVLVLSGRVAHCEQLAESLVADGVEAVALTSRMPKHKRSDVLERFRAGTLRVVCATSLADEGLDVARLERLILATPARAEGRTVQRLGRLMRPHPDKRPPVLYDLVDDMPLARNQFAAREQAYRQVLGAHAANTGG
ncbi:DEAD/DEAH box helicase [Haliangium ochraceum]|uniref:Type III restriction protein res subunit n=1 Tax=Haliangium ochraceum (strain DSM 14365 / JCM 11303 / SMP-2) TaxID=502025 RepID=D0LN18_HALO1|nr:DEAD/DEAH box helicase [Haliangium ochraceum]ACY13389.1 type III restriction protein res subunit [Haliangium ochraceum DSM 14365]